MARKSPNIIVTGTPGVGKTSHAEMLAEKTGLKHLAINTVAEENNCYDGRDEELQTWIVDEDKVRKFFFLETIFWKHCLILSSF